MKTLLPIVVLLLFGACGDNDTPKGPISYTDPTGGKLRLIQVKPINGQSPNALVLALVVGDQPLTGYSVGFDLPLDDSKVKLKSFTPGTALPAGTSPVAAMGVLPAAGPLAHQLVTAQSQKASGPGAVTTDATLSPGTVLYTMELDAITGQNGVVFDGTASGFLLVSAGLRNRTGTSVVDPADVAIGKLEVNL